MIKNRIKHDNSKSPLVEAPDAFNFALQSQFLVWETRLKVVSCECHKGRVCRIVKNTLSTLSQVENVSETPQEKNCYEVQISVS